MGNCNKCKGMIVMHAFCNTECIKCGDKIKTPHMPGHKVCKTCSEKYNLCEQCGKELNN